MTPAQITKVFGIGAAVSITLAAFAALAVTTIMPIVAKDLQNLKLYPLAFGMALAGQLIGTAGAGGWCDSRGPKPSLYVGLTCFVGGLVVCGSAPTMEVFIAGRTFQGLGGGFLMVAMYVLVGMLVPEKSQPKIFAIFAASWILPAMVGPGLAGVIVQYLSWRTIFFLLIPFIALAAVVLLPLMSAVETIERPLASHMRRILISAICAGAGVSLVMIGTSLAGVTNFVVTLIGLLLLVFGVPRMFPAGTLRLRSGLPSIIASRGMVNAAFVATESFLPLLLQTHRGWSPKETGLIITVGSLTWALGSVIQGRVSKESSRIKLPLIGGIIGAVGVVTTAFAAFLFVPAWVAGIGWAIGGLGIGLSYPALAVLALGRVPQAKHGEASSYIQLADSLGSASAIALVGIVFQVLSDVSGPLPYLVAPALAGVLALISAWAGARIGSSFSSYSHDIPDIDFPELDEQ